MCIRRPRVKLKAQGTPLFLQRYFSWFLRTFSLNRFLSSIFLTLPIPVWGRYLVKGAVIDSPTAPMQWRVKRAPTRFFQTPPDDSTDPRPFYAHNTTTSVSSCQRDSLTANSAMGSYRTFLFQPGGNKSRSGAIFAIMLSRHGKGHFYEAGNWDIGRHAGV